MTLVELDFLVLGWLLAEAYYRIVLPRIARRLVGGGS